MTDPASASGAHRRLAWAAWALIALGALLRVAGAGAWNPYWTDEFNHVLGASAYLEGRGMVLPTGVPVDRAPAYTGLVAASFAVFGEHELAARLPSIVFSAGALVLLWVYGARVLGPVAALAALFLFATDEWIVRWGRTCRMYAPMQFANIGVLLLAMDLARNWQDHSRRKRALLAALAAAAALWGLAMHILFGTALAGVLCGAWLVAVGRSVGHRAARRRLLALGLVAVAGLSLALEAIPRLPGYIRLGYDYVFGDETKWGIVDLLSQSGALLPIGVAWLLWARRRDPAAHLLAGGVAFGVVFFFRFSVFQSDRYYLVFQDMYLLLAAMLLGELWERRGALARRWGAAPRWAPAAAFALVVAALLYDSSHERLLSSPGSYARRQRNAEWSQAVRAAWEASSPGDAFAATEQFALYYYLPPEGRSRPLRLLRDRDLALMYPRAIVRDGTTYERLTGMPLIDSLEKLAVGVPPGGALWLVVDDSKWGNRLSRPLRDAIESRAEEIAEFHRVRVLRIPGG
ncbi:MAG: glycosyltransferase family 39 protein [Candidatus Sumerlaeia bacterium]|nr:glycosyltransferase family 39 protein [Candidatus Sumerlaeia bacterium]